MKNDLLKIVQHYEISNQQRKFVEECYELIEAIVNMQMKKREMEGKTPDIVEPTLQTYREHITEEIADVMVMLKQFQYYYGIDDEQVEDVMNYKIDRQLDRIEKEKNNEC